MSSDSEVQSAVGRVVGWEESGDAFFPYVAAVDGVQWRLRINDFPDEPLYTLFCGDVEVGDIEDWPAAWQRPVPALETEDAPETQKAVGAVKHPKGRWIPLGRAGGVRFFVDPVFVLVAALLVWMGDAAVPWTSRLMLVAILLGSVLWHELGHAICARLLRLRVGGVYLHLLPFAYVDRGAPREEWRVALAGPVASLLAARTLSIGSPPFWDALHGGPAVWAQYPQAFAMLVNLLMGFVNLVPALPLDGGRALRALLQIRASAATARTVVFVVAVLVVIALGATAWFMRDRAWAIPLAFLAVFLGTAALRERTTSIA